MLLLLAGNCLPYHQPKCPTTKDPKKALGLKVGLLGFLLRCEVGDSVYTYPRGVLKPTTLVDSQLHQMHLMHPTWFNGAHHRWRKTSGEHSTTMSVMLKRFLGSKVYRLPSSTIELPHDPFRVVSVAERGCSSHATELYGFGVIGVALPLAFATPVADLHWGGTYWCTSSPHTLGRLCSLQVTCSGRHHQAWRCCHWQGPHWPRQEWWCFWEPALLWPLWQTGRTR